MTEFTPLSRFRKFIKRVEDLSRSFGDELQARSMKTGGTAGQVPRKTASTDFTWTWSNLGWNDVTGKPTNFPTNISNVSGLQAALNGKASLTGAVFTGNVTISGVFVLSTSRLNLQGVPTSPVGLTPGDIWSDAGSLMVVS